MWVFFVALLFVFDVGRLWTLVAGSDVGVLATIMLVVFNAIVFSGVQFAFSIMRMASKTEDTSVPPTRPVPVPRSRPTDIPSVRGRDRDRRDSA
jgi:hypothetical protein